MRTSLALLLFATAAPAADPPANVADALKAITSVSKEGTGNEAAAAGWKVVASAGGEALIPTLTAFDGANPTAANWLRSAVDAIVEKETKAGKKLTGIWDFVKDTKRSPEARRIAFELARVEDKAAADQLLPEMTNDPNLEIRKEAIAAKLATVTETSESIPARKAAIGKLFEQVRDKEQAEKLAKVLTDLGEKPNLTRHFGCVTEWQIVGPFDSPKGVGFAQAYSPEKGVDLKAEYEGKGGAKLTWKPVTSEDTYGKCDLNKDLGKHMDCVAYAFAVVVAKEETPVEIRAASPNSIQIYLNGKKLFQREEYHHGSVMDQHTGKGTLKAGKNEVLIKLVQNNQAEKWAQSWDFSARVCDWSGGALPLKQEVIRDGKPQLVDLGAIRETPKKEGK